MKNTKHTNTIAETRESHSKIPSCDRIAVIVSTPYAADCFYYGVQFWTEEQITEGKQQNTDKSFSQFVELL